MSEDRPQRSEPVFSAEAMAQLLKMSARQLQYLARDGHVPKAAHGQYPLIGTVHGYIDYLKSKQAQGSKNLEASTRLKDINTELRQIELRKIRGELVESEAMFVVIGEILVKVMRELRAIGARCATQCEGRSAAEIKRVFEDETVRVQGNIFQRLRAIGSRFADALADRRAPAAKDAGSMGRRRTNSSG